MPTRSLVSSSTASRPEIRAAYWCQLSRIRTGELPGFLEDSIEAAFATLDYPDRRVEYDVQLAVDGQRDRRFAAVTDPGSWMPFPVSAARIGRTLAGLALIAAAALVLTLSFGGAGRRGPTVRQTVARNAPVVNPVPARPWQDSNSVDAAVAPQPAEIAPSPSVDAVSAPAPAPKPSVAAAAPPAGRAAAPPAVAPAFAYIPAAPDETAGEQPINTAPAPAVPAPVPAVAPAGAPTVMTLATVWSRPFVGARITTRVGGRYCLDSSGGQVFTPINSPVSSALSC